MTGPLGKIMIGGMTFAATVLLVFWLRSYGMVDQITFEPTLGKKVPYEPIVWGIKSKRGTLGIWRSRDEAWTTMMRDPGVEATRKKLRYDAFSLKRAERMTMPEPTGYWDGITEFRGLGFGNYRGTRVGGNMRVVELPYVLLAALLLIWPIVALSIRIRREARARRGRCVRCGYDVRYAEDDCPECGAPISPITRSVAARMAQKQEA